MTPCCMCLGKGSLIDGRPGFPKIRACRHCGGTGREPTGSELADRGMQAAADHAERVTPGWRDGALEHVRRFALAATGPFLCEDVRRVAEAAGFPPPPDNRAWGAVMRRAAGHGFVKHGGYTPATNPNVHRAIVGQWTSLIQRAAA